MARTVDSTLDLPREQALAIAEICAQTLDAHGGIAEVARCLNTLYEQLRGNLVNDTGQPLVETGGRTTAYYRCRTMGGSSLTDENVDCWFDLVTTGAAAVRFVHNSTSSQWSGTQGTRAWVQGATSPATDDSGEYIDASVSVSSGTASVYGVSCGYDRAKAALTAVTAGSAGYTGSGVVPIDLANVVGESPLSVARLLDMHALAIYLLTCRPGQIVCTANPAADDAFWCAAPVPVCQSGEATARFYVRQDGTGAETLTIAGGGDSDTASSTASEDWTAEFDLTVPAPTSVLQAPVFALFTLDPDGVDVYGWSGWWRDSSYA